MYGQRQIQIAQTKRPPAVSWATFKQTTEFFISIMYTGEYSK